MNAKLTNDLFHVEDEAAARESPREAVRTFSAANDVVAAVMAAALDTRNRHPFSKACLQHSQTTRETTYSVG